MRIIRSLLFLLLYCREVLVSTARLTALVLRPNLSIQPRFVDVPLDLRGDFPRFLFACLITMTPGTLSVGLNDKENILVVHLIDAADPDAAVREIKDVLEKPLIRIFH